MLMKNLKKSIAWEKGCQLVLNTYKTTQSFPKEELYGIVSQIRRCSVSIPSNIAEGLLRSSSLELARFLSIAKGSCGELSTQLIISYKLKYINKKTLEELLKQIQEITKILYSSIKTIKHQ